MTKLVLQAGLEAEMSSHLGYDKHAVEGRNSGNSRNGTRTKTVITEVGPVELDVPRERAGSFEPVTVPKRVRRLRGVDEMVISLVARGMGTGDVQAHLAEVYGTSVSSQQISDITDAVVEKMGRRMSVTVTSLSTSSRIRAAPGSSAVLSLRDRNCAIGSALCHQKKTFAVT